MAQPICEECERVFTASEARMCREFIEALDEELKAIYAAIYPGTPVVCARCLAAQFSHVATQ